MALADSRLGINLAQPDPNLAWSPTVNPAMAELLDHIAKELARDYVRLMEAAAKNGLVDRNLR